MLGHEQSFLHLLQVLLSHDSEVLKLPVIDLPVLLLAAFHVARHLIVIHLEPLLDLVQVAMMV